MGLKKSIRSITDQPDKPLYDDSVDAWSP
jgi:hypothetical protein